MAYAPAENLTTDAAIAHVQSVIYYNKVGMSTLQKNFRHGNLGEPDILPRRSGKTVQWFRHAELGANTTAATEGALPTGLDITSDTVSASVSEYDDYINMSTLLVETALDDIVQAEVQRLAYRLGLSIDTIVRTELESVNSSVDEDPVGSYLSADDFRKINALLQAADVKPKSGGYFQAITSPYTAYDLTRDATAGGFIDMSKYTRPERLETMQDRGLLGRIAGVEIWVSTNVATSGSSPTTKYHTTVVGEGCLGVVDLAGSGIGNLRTQSVASTMPIKVVMGGNQIADPSNKIGAAVAYRVVWVTKLLRTGSADYRFRIIEADSSITT